MPPLGFAKPDDWHHGPNCGVLALAVVHGRPFRDVWAELSVNYTANWRGRTHWDEDILPYLKRHGIAYAPVELSWYGRIPRLHRFGDYHYTDEHLYVLSVPGHIMCYRRGYLLDQKGLQWYGDLRNYKLDDVIRIL